MKKLLLSLVLLASLITCNSNSKPVKSLEAITEVKIGQVGFLKTSLVSRNFNTCSAIILDYRDNGFMAHAVPYVKGLPEIPDCYVTSRNAVRKLCELAQSQSINPSDCEARVYAGTEQDYEIIIRDLKQRKIKIKSAKYRKEGLEKRQNQDIYYNPRTNRLVILNSN